MIKKINYAKLIFWLVLTFISTNAVSAAKSDDSTVTQIALTPAPHFVKHKLKGVWNPSFLITAGRYAWLSDSERVAFFDGEKWLSPAGIKYNTFIRNIYPDFPDSGKTGNSWALAGDFIDNYLIKFHNATATKMFSAEDILGMKPEPSYYISVHVLGGYVFLFAQDHNALYYSVYNPTTEKWLSPVAIPNTKDTDVPNYSTYPITEKNPEVLLRLENNSNQRWFKIDKNGVLSNYNVPITSSSLYTHIRVNSSHIYISDGHSKLVYKKLNENQWKEINSSQPTFLEYIGKQHENNGLVCGTTQLDGEFICIDTNDASPSSIKYFSIPDATGYPDTEIYAKIDGAWIIDNLRRNKSPHVFNYNYKLNKMVDTNFPIHANHPQDPASRYVRIIPKQVTNNLFITCSRYINPSTTPALHFYNDKEKNASWVEINNTEVAEKKCQFSESADDSTHAQVDIDNGETLWLVDVDSDFYGEDDEIVEAKHHAHNFRDRGKRLPHIKSN